MKIGIIGLGTIGLKLCEYLSEKKYEICAYNYQRIEEKENKFLNSLEQKVKFGKISMNDFDFLKNRVTFIEDLKEMNSVDLIIEALQENYETKKKYYNFLNDNLNSQKIIATTTSSLNLNKLNKYVGKNSLIGLHFFNPPTKMKLVEMSFLDNTSDEIKQFIYKFISSFDDKKIIEIPPIQGYIVNRLLFVYINYSIKYFMETGIKQEDIDEAIKLGTNNPMGPLELSDYIGNDITLQILEEFYTVFHDDIYKPVELLVQMVNNNELGRKTKKGFYQY